MSSGRLQIGDDEARRNFPFAVFIRNKLHHCPTLLPHIIVPRLNWSALALMWFPRVFYLYIPIYCYFSRYGSWWCLLFLNAYGTNDVIAQEPAAAPKRRYWKAGSGAGEDEWDGESERNSMPGLRFSQSRVMKHVRRIEAFNLTLPRAMVKWGKFWWQTAAAPSAKRRFSHLSFSISLKR